MSAEGGEVMFEDDGFDSRFGVEFTHVEELSIKDFDGIEGSLDAADMTQGIVCDGDGGAGGGTREWSRFWKIW